MRKNEKEMPGTSFQAVASRTDIEENIQNERKVKSAKAKSDEEKQVKIRYKSKQETA